MSLLAHRKQPFVDLANVRGFTEFWREQYESCVQTLHPVRFIANTFGGSHAQRDIVEWTLTEAALRSGNPNIATALVHERAALTRPRPTAASIENCCVVRHDGRLRCRLPTRASTRTTEFI